MGRLIAAINMSLDGFCDHTGMIADEELHQHYSDLLTNAGAILYGRVTYQLMEDYWPGVAKKPTGIKSMDEFAMAIDNIPKIVFSNTMKQVGWKTAKLAKGNILDEVAALRKQTDNDILVGCRSLIVSLLNMGLIDEFQLCVHPVLAGNGTAPLLKDIDHRISLRFNKTKTFDSGAIILYYEPDNKT